MKRTVLFAPNIHAKRCCAGLYQRQMERMWAEIEAQRDNPHRENADVTVASNVVRGTLGVRLDDDQYIGCMRLRTLRSLLQIIDEETAFERCVLSQSLFCPARRPSLSNPSSTVLWRDILPTSTNPITTNFCADIGLAPRTSCFESVNLFFSPFFECFTSSLMILRVGPYCFTTNRDAQRISICFSFHPAFLDTINVMFFLYRILVLSFDTGNFALSFTGSCMLILGSLRSFRSIIDSVMRCDVAGVYLWVLVHIGGAAAWYTVVPIFPRIELGDPSHLSIIQFIDWYVFLQQTYCEIV